MQLFGIQMAHQIHYILFFAQAEIWRDYDDFNVDAELTVLLLELQISQMIALWT